MLDVQCIFYDVPSNSAYGRREQCVIMNVKITAILLALSLHGLASAEILRGSDVPYTQVKYPLQVRAPDRDGGPDFVTLYIKPPNNCSPGDGQSIQVKAKPESGSGPWVDVPNFMQWRCRGVVTSYSHNMSAERLKQYERRGIAISAGGPLITGLTPAMELSFPSFSELYSYISQISAAEAKPAVKRPQPPPPQTGGKLSGAEATIYGVSLNSVPSAVQIDQAAKQLQQCGNETANLSRRREEDGWIGLEYSCWFSPIATTTFWLKGGVLKYIKSYYPGRWHLFGSKYCSAYSDAIDLTRLNKNPGSSWTLVKKGTYTYSNLLASRQLPWVVYKKGNTYFHQYHDGDERVELRGCTSLSIPNVVEIYSLRGADSEAPPQ